MVKKNIDNKNSNSNHGEDKNKDLHNILNLNNIDDENFKEEALFVYNAVKEGNIDLDPEEKAELLQELDLILNHMDSSKPKDESVSLDKTNDNSDNEVNSQDKSEEKSINQNSLNASNDESGESEGSINVNESDDEESSNESGESEGSMDVNESDDEESSNESDKDEDSDDLSVDDVLNELITDNSPSPDYSNQLVDDIVPDDMEHLPAKGPEDLGSDDLSVDDALNDLIVNYSDEVAIKVNNVSMEFTVSKDKIDTLKEFVIRTIKRNKSPSKTILALDNVSFEIPKGDRVGIIGFNGAGKSTLLKVLSGVYDATEGTIETKGKIAPLLALGAGFDPNYTGKDNIFLNGAFLGYSEEFLSEKYDEILEFSELGDAINYHVKTYSSGMRAKLAFSIATIVEPDILIIDEILSVGDIKFKKKSADKIRSLINSGITVLLVSHSVGQIRDLCNKAMWINEGKLIMYGEVNEVCDAYVKASRDATYDQLKDIELN